MQIATLMNHMFAGNRSSLLESLSVLLALLHHYPNVSTEKQQFGDEYEEKPPPPLAAVEEKMNANPLAPKQSETACTRKGIKTGRATRRRGGVGAIDTRGSTSGVLPFG
eukprot:482530_1